MESGSCVVEKGTVAMMCCCKWEGPSFRSSIHSTETTITLVGMTRPLYSMKIRHHIVDANELPAMKGDADHDFTFSKRNCAADRFPRGCCFLN